MSNDRDDTIKAPDFLHWYTHQHTDEQKLNRHWFGKELKPKSLFSVRGIGIYEPMYNKNVCRPIGTGDWLIMLFHHPVRLDKHSKKPSSSAKTLIIWPPGEKQYFSWDKGGGKEKHSWMHVEGTWVTLQIEGNLLPISTPVILNDESVMINALQHLADEMVQPVSPDPVILQNLFQNWARSIARDIKTIDPKNNIPKALLETKHFLDKNFNKRIVLDELSGIANMSRSHLCHQFRFYFKTSISNYVTRKRMAIAQSLLFNIDMRLTQIAEILGYSDIYQFSKQFKKTFGVSPSQYRKQQK